MRVALVAKAIYPARGGVELHVHNLAHELAKLGYEVNVFTADGARQDSRPNGYVLSSGMGNLALHIALRRGHYDIVHAHGARTPVASWALLSGKSLGLHTVFTPHCFYPAQDWRGKIKRSLFDPTLGKLSLRHADRIICLTENDRRDAITQGASPENICIIPNSIRWPRCPQENAVADFRRKYGLENFLLSVGRLDRVKQGDFLISALAQLPPDLQLVFIGPDAGAGLQWKRHAENLGLSNRTKFIPEVADDELLCAYKASVALVMASAYEGLPTVLLEAMAMGTPVIAADAGGIGYLLRHEVNGFLFSAGDQEALCSHVCRCLRKFPCEMVRTAQQQVEENYCLEKTISRIVALYQRES